MHRVLKEADATGSRTAAEGAVSDVVAGILAEVRARGDAAVREYSQRFDGWAPESFRLGADEIERIVADVPTQVLDDIRWVQRQVCGFAQAQMDSLGEFEMETLPRARLGQRHIPVAASGAYVPRGAVSVDRVGAHNGVDGEGSRSGAGGGVHAADRRGDPGGDGGCVLSGRGG